MLTLCCCQDVEDSVEYSKGDNYHGIQSIRTGSTRSIWVSSTVPTTAAATARGYMATTISTIAITTTMATSTAAMATATTTNATAVSTTAAMATATTRQSRATNGCTSNTTTVSTTTNATAVSTTAAVATATTRQSRATNGCTSNAAARVSLSITADDDATTSRQREHSTTPTWLFRAFVVLHLYWLVGRVDLVMACLWDVRLHPDHAGWNHDVQYTARCHHSAEKLAR